MEMKFDNTTKEKAAELLQEASKVIDNGHWVRGTFHTHDFTKHCALGGLDVAYGKVSGNPTAHGLAIQELLKQMQKEKNVVSIPHYNDNYGTQAKDVIRCMRMAAETLLKGIKPAVEETDKEASKYFFKGKTGSSQTRRTAQ